ncbi:MAG: flagellar biosynthesis protein FlhF [Pseudomonadota bacterium]
MNIRKFVAATSRDALRQVREALGGDAVILANRPVDGGVEILAAAPDDVATLTTRVQPKAQDFTPPPTVDPVFSERAANTMKMIADAQVARARKRLLPVEKTETPEPAVPAPTAAMIANLASANSNANLAEEIRSMRDFIEEHLANFSLGESVRRQPTRTKIMQDMHIAGFSPALSRRLQQNLPDDFSTQQARDWVCSVLEKNLICASAEEDLIEHGGVYALVGPTGVGKTTTTAKLAARFAVKYGADKLALITTDGYRIGAQDQLRIYGKILGVPVHTIQDEVSLANAIQHLSQRRLVLIDTAGMSQRDQRVAEQIAMLRGASAKRILVLNATVQAETLEDVIAAYGDKSFSGCIVSKLDEAVRFGGVLDVIIRHRLHIHYVASGQRVPEDLHRPNARYLVHRALKEITPNAAFALQEDDYPSWVGVNGKNTQGSTRETNAGDKNHV